MELSGIVPTKGNLLATNKTLAMVRVGYELMDRKHSILVREMMELISRAQALRGVIDDTFNDAYAALQRANITLGACGSIAESMPVERGLSVTFRSVMGVELPTARLAESELRIPYDFSSTNTAFDLAYTGFHNVKLLTVQLAEVENSVFRLAVAIKKTQSRANAMKNIIIPKLEYASKFIADALEEKSREEFARMKVIKQSKQGK